MKRIFLLLIACCFLSTLLAQSTRKIRELEAKRKELHQQIAESETLLQSTKKDVKSQLDNLALLTGQIEDRAKIIRVIAGIANNINQAVKLGNSQGRLYYSDIDKLQSSMDEVKKTFGEVLEVWRLQRS